MGRLVAILMRFDTMLVPDCQYLILCKTKTLLNCRTAFGSVVLVHLSFIAAD